MDRKVLSQGISMRNMKATSLSVQKLVPRLSFFKVGQKVEVKVTIFGIDRKVLPQGMHTCNMKALSLLIKKVMSMVSFLQK